MAKLPVEWEARWRDPMHGLVNMYLFGNIWTNTCQRGGSSVDIHLFCRWGELFIELHMFWAVRGRGESSNWNRTIFPITPRRYTNVRILATSTGVYNLWLDLQAHSATVCCILDALWTCRSAELSCESYEPWSLQTARVNNKPMAIYCTLH